jgi:adenine-specific DNA-methyltransferase
MSIIKLSSSQDSNTLNKSFYYELLHIMGLTEVKKGGKKLIYRNKINKRFSGSLLENTINELENLDKIKGLETDENQLFNRGVELAIAWINRILFLKFLEDQLINYHQGDKSYSFLTLDKMKNYEDLNRLFFEVLCCQKSQRNQKVKDVFNHVPYLNSSLFEPTDLEQETIFISNLKDHKLPIFSVTVLKDSQGNKLKGELNSLEYLFDFLKTYNFSSEGREEIKEDHKRLINASVLGLIFEKINGYKYGSFFTPGFITMYICRETIRTAIAQKFHEVKQWNCQNFSDLKEDINNYIMSHQNGRKTARTEINHIINSLKICDPSVGSGHFLVSALNEMISIKQELGILQDHQGDTLSGYQIEVVNDELIITDNHENFFAYNPQNKESQRIQKTLFHEKQTIIENCLFGVDINPNSVKICRLRLWIELLKNAYYQTEETQKPGFFEKPGFFPKLQTLPNIDIKIKCGNSLISRFPLNDQVFFSPVVKQEILTYKKAVTSYFNTQDKSEKRQIKRSLKKINDTFRTSLQGIDPKKTKLRNLESELFDLEHPNLLFEETTKEKKAREKKINKLQNEIDKLRVEIEKIDTGKIYQNAFEWRFEFPEVLNDQGEFIGFDVIIGNPPYGVELSKLEQNTLNNIYNFGTTETAILSIKKGWELLNKNGYQSYIIPKSYTFASNYAKIREFTVKNLISLVDCGKVWTDVKLEVCIFILTNLYQSVDYNSHKIVNFQVINQGIISKDLVTKFDFFLNGLSTEEINIGLKIIDNCQTLNDISTNQRGAMIQKLLSDHGDRDVIGGAEVQKYGIKGIKGKVNFQDIYEQKAFIKKNSILVQRIVAHIENPHDHIKITATIPDRDDYLLVDTINQITLNENFPPKLIWSILHSTLINWYVYRFIFAKAIRTMQFDNPTTSRIPIPKIINSDVKKVLCELVNQILTLKKSHPDTDTSKLEREIDLLVYELYGLTEEETKIIENN